MGKRRGDEASSTAVAKRPKESELSLITTPPQVFSWIKESDQYQCGLIPPIKTRTTRSPECESTEVKGAKTKGLIECPKQRAATFKRRLKGLLSGCSQLSTLCGVQVVFVYRTPGTEPQVQSWAPQTSEVQAHSSTAFPSQSTPSALTDIDLDFSGCGDLCFSPMPASQVPPSEVMVAAAEETASTLSPDLDLDFADFGCLF